MVDDFPAVRQLRQRGELLPKLARGEEMIQSFRLTEPNAGSDSMSIDTRIKKDGDKYVVNGQKIWILRFDTSNHLLLMTRRTPRMEVDKRTKGTSMFLVNLDEAFDQGGLTIEQMDKTASNFVHSYEMWFEELRVPEDHLIGEEDEGIYQMLDGLNEERLVNVAECIGLGEVALKSGVGYASEREVFGRPSGRTRASNTYWRRLMPESRP